MYEINRYYAFHFIRQKRSGGISIFIRNAFPGYTEVEVPNNCLFNSHMGIVIHTKLNICITVIYITPQDVAINARALESWLNDTFEWIHDRHRNVICVAAGDFNKLKMKHLCGR